MSQEDRGSAFEALKNVIGKLVSIPPLEWVHFISLLGFRKLEKDQIYFSEGEQFGEIGFVVRGLMYNYYLKPDGDQVVTYIAPEGKAVSPYSNQMLGTPSFCTSKALEKTLLLTLQYSDLQKLYKRHICWANMGRLFAEELYVYKEEREHSLQALDGKSRYEMFLKNFGKNVGRVPLFVIASYIGVSQVHLSRIRSSL